MSRIDIEQRRKAAVLQIVGGGVVVLHDQPDELLHMFGALEDRRCGAVSATPHQGQPFAGHNQVGAHQDASQEAVKFTDKHRLAVVRQAGELFLKLLQMSRNARHAASSSTAAVRRRG